MFDFLDVSSLIYRAPALLIGGGYDKQSGYDEWIEAFDGKVRYLVLIGQTKEKIKEAAEKHGFHDIILCEDLKEAVKVGEEKAQPGDAVLLSRRQSEVSDGSLPGFL